MGFKSFYAVTGQTYPRKVDSLVLNALALSASSAYKFSNDLRLLQNLKEMEEPFEKNQIGSSAMAYKRNPMRSERMAALARFLLFLPQNALVTASTQWFERTLDDSANKRLTVPQAFLCLDAILNIYLNISEGMVVYKKTINKHIMEELPFMATETILMEAVKKGGDRQELHEKIRSYSMEASHRIKAEGKGNNLIENIAADSSFGFTKKALDSILDPVNFIGRSSEQVDDFISTDVAPILAEYKNSLGIKGVLNV